MSEAFSQAFPTLNLDRMRILLSDSWGHTECTLSPFGSERDDTVKVVSREGDFVLKIAHPGDDVLRIQRQLSLMTFVAGTTLPFATQAPIPTRTGDITAVVEGRIAHLLPFLPGTPIRQHPLDEEGVSAVGQAVWHLQQQLSGYPGVYDTEHPWALPFLSFAASKLDLVEPASLRRGCQKIIDMAVSSTVPALDNLPAYPSHNDAHTDNLLVSGQKVVGIVDWGDSVSQPQVADLAVAASYARNYHPMWLEGDPWRAAHTLRRGYVDAGGSDEHSNLFGELVLSRLVQRIVLNLAIAATASDGGSYAKRNMVASVRDANDLFVTRADNVFPDLGRDPLW